MKKHGSLLAIIVLGFVSDRCIQDDQMSAKTTLVPADINMWLQGRLQDDEKEISITSRRSYAQ